MGCHRDLHSFPTRRSSDLSNIRSPSLADDAAYATLVARECGLFVCSRAHWDSISPKPGETRFVPVDDDEAWAVRDRKSTRLNSSHANISYAVFCLKKKKLN